MKRNRLHKIRTKSTLAPQKIVMAVKTAYSPSSGAVQDVSMGMLKNNICCARKQDPVFLMHGKHATHFTAAAMKGYENI
jgi:hypothetical protein